MENLDRHPTVIRYRKRAASQSEAMRRVDAEWLRRLCLEAGADDVGFVAIDRPEIADQRDAIRALFPTTKTLVSFVCRMNREPIRSPARSVANLEFRHTDDRINTVAHTVVSRLEEHGIRGINPAAGFPMEAQTFPRQMWLVSHKPIAVAAGLGQMGIHRNVIHPKFGNFILLGTVLVDAEVTAQGEPIEYNPCLKCKLCVAACPVGAISPGGDFNFTACFTHNYREFMGGFNDWVETVVASKTVPEYRAKVSSGETASLWQSLSFKPNYKAAYCMAVCPAGEDVIGPFLASRADYLQDVVRPLQEKVETIYVTPGSDAEEHVRRRFPHKQLKRVGSGIRLETIDAFLRGLPRTFQPKQAAGLSATYHFSFHGAESRQATVIIRDQAVSVLDGHTGTADLHVRADSETWLGLLAKEQNLLLALVWRKIRLQGSPKLMLAFRRCFAR